MQLAAATYSASVVEKAESDRRAAIADGRAQAAVKETGAMAESYERVSKELADLKAKIESSSLDPFNNVDCMGEYAYYLAYADAIRDAARAGHEFGALVEAFKAYATELPLEPSFMLPILDLSTKHGIDLSWYPMQGNLIPPPHEEPEQVLTKEPTPQTEPAA
ncbi:hypothetical protein OROGR_032462 [Orobanche gracilis]